MMHKEEEPGTFPEPVPPHPGWILRSYRVSRPVSRDDIDAFLGAEDLYLRETRSGKIFIIRKYGLLEIHAIVGNPELQVWFNPEKSGYSSEFLDALLATRF